jgi:hypothetical protein
MPTTVESGALAMHLSTMQLSRVRHLQTNKQTNKIKKKNTSE